MNKTKKIYFLLLCLVLTSCSTRQIYTPHKAIPTETEPPAPLRIEVPTEIPKKCLRVKRALEFLKARYNPTLSLLNESPEVAPHTYWLTNDNALAAYALERLGETEWSKEVWSAIRHYGSASNGLIEALWGTPVPFPPYTAKNVLVEKAGNDEIWQELHDGGTRFEDWAEYADLSFWGALNAYQQGHEAEALDIFARTMKMFDGAGFRDKAFDGQYETYKLALALHVGAAIRAPIPEAEVLISTLHAMQTAEGGFATHYRDSFHITGDANTETTSLALLALIGECQNDPSAK
jgi:tetratricopeptide (TPR) repeat protein